MEEHALVADVVDVMGPVAVVVVDAGPGVGIAVVVGGVELSVGLEVSFGCMVGCDRVEVIWI